MKKYIFLTFAVFGIGGTQIYVRNKLLYLQKRGFEVKVLTTEADGEIMVKELEAFAELTFPEVMNNPYLYSKNEREHILDKMCKALGEVDKDSVIESNFIQATLWGELLAQKLKIKHFILLIQEDYTLGLAPYLKYYKFKLDRGELAVNTKFALKQLFSGYCDLPENLTADLLPVCFNTVEDCQSRLPELLPKADYTIASLGRVNKPFVLPMVKELTQYAKSHKDKSFLLLFIGGSPDKNDYEDIKNTATADNLQVYITGPIFPVPYCLLKCADVFISSAGAARTSADEGFTTIVLDANDFKPMGIVGITTNDLVHRSPDSPIVPTELLLDEVLFQKKYPHTAKELSNIQPEIDTEFDRHLAYLDKSEKSLDYYDMKKIQPALKRKIIKLIYHR